MEKTKDSKRRMLVIMKTSCFGTGAISGVEMSKLDQKERIKSKLSAIAPADVCIKRL